MRALSKISTLLVAARTITLVEPVLKPSISTSSWLRVFSASLWPPMFLPPLFLPTASISSINRIQGEFFLARANMSLTLAGPTPTNISRNSEPDTEMKGTLASPAVALPSNVFPVPGGPFKMAPLGIFQKVDKFHNFNFSLFTASHVFKGHFNFIWVDNFGSAVGHAKN